MNIFNTFIPAAPVAPGAAKTMHPSSARPARILFSQWLLLAAGLACLPAAAADDAEKMALGKKLFNTAIPACAICHTLKDAGSEGAVGPILDELKPNAARVSKALRDGLGAMPSFKATLTEAEINVLAYYVSRASGAEK
ncbi:MAG: cytochrome c [Polaromonas sp.]